ncbi:MAG TPA: iron ABC transporter permease [Tepidisphaeraceae bacterium]
MIVALFVWAIVGLACSLIGSTGYGWPTWSQAEVRLSTHILPASLIGAALAAAGVAFQAVLRNPLADPYLLGTSGGAMLGAYLWRLPAISGIFWIGVLAPQGLALLGALGATALVLGLAGVRGRIEPVTAILIGVIINSLCGSAFLLINAMVRDLPAAGGAMTFFVGDLQTSLPQAYYVTSGVAIAAGFVGLMMLAPALNIIRLSDDEAAALGIRVQRARWSALLCAAIVTAAAVAISGPIGFIGLICPHIARWFVGNDNRRLLPVSAAAGASALAVADAVSRYLLGVDRVATVIPVGVVTAVLGGPFFLYLLTRSRRA